MSSQLIIIITTILAFVLLGFMMFWSISKYEKQKKKGKFKSKKRTRNSEQPNRFLNKN